MHLSALSSGGKDSSLAHWLALENGHKIENIVSMIPNRNDSWMFHKPDEKIIQLYAKAAELPLIKKRTSGIKEQELNDLKNVLAELSTEGVVSGAVASSYQKSRIEKICRDLNLKSIHPLWNQNPLHLMKELLKKDFEIIITSVSAEGLGKEWLGRKITEKSLKELKNLSEKHGIHLAGEGGEYETLSLNTPFFKKRIKLTETEKIWKKDRGHLKINKSTLIEK